MEYVPGDTVARRKVAQPGMCFEPAQVRPWIEQLTSALDYAHTKAGVVHRDLKPLNLMLDAQDELKVTDFGIARSVRQSATRLSVEAKGAMMTVSYGSPQQAMGEPAAISDDIYALGATIYELVTGKPPFFEGNILAQLREIVPPPMAQRRRERGVHDRGEIPFSWERTVAACLRKDPNERPPSAGTVLAMLDGKISDGTIEVLPSRLPSPGDGNEAGLRPAEGESVIGRDRTIEVVAASKAPRIGDPKLPAAPPEAGKPATTGKQQPAFSTDAQRRPAGRKSKMLRCGGLAAALALVAAGGWYFASFLPEQRRLEAEQQKVEQAKAEARKVEVAKAEARKIEKEKADALAREQTEKEQREYAVAVAKIDALVDGSAPAQRESTETAVKSYLGTAPARLRSEVEGKLTARVAAWEAARLAAARGGVIVSTTPAGAEVRAKETAPAHAVLEKLRGPEPGQRWTIPELGLELMPIAAGTFTMGSQYGDIDEKPETRVRLSKGFWLGKTEVTQKQWQAVMGNNPSSFKGDDRPVEQVSWEEAMAFCRELTERERAAERLPEGYAYSLPTEAQWEYACRAGTTGEYAGDLEVMAWCGSNSGSQPHPVGQKRANGWGLHDLHGNVWEWCLDWYGNYPGGSVTDPKSAASGSNRVRRGGSWDSSAHNCRSAYRNWLEPGNRGRHLGFRLALSSVH
jgi:formylglycine-generating enzyme required for sulfatase activity